jgi:hypothetical protein
MRRCGTPYRFAAQHEGGQASLPWADRDCSNSRELPAVPIARYFMVAGSALAVLLLIAGWSLPELPPSFPDRREISDRAIIRIRSERKWPEKIVLDTSKPTITPPVVMDPPKAQSSVPLVPDEAPGRSNFEAITELKSDPRPVAIARPALKIKRGVARTARSSRVARRSITHRLARAETGRGCCQFDKAQASPNAMRFGRAASSWLFE